MNDLRTECEKCGQHIEVPAEMAGETAECASCGAVILVTSELADEAEDLVDSPTEEPEIPSETATAEQEKRGIGKSLLAVAGAAAGEAKRGTKMAALKAKIEKLRRVDLHRAYRELGRKAYEIRSDSDTHSQAYADIESLEAQIDEKRAGIHVDTRGTVADRAKTAALGAKMKAEGEVLAHKRNSLMASLGKAVATSECNEEAISTEVEACVRLQHEIDSLASQVDGLTADRSSREELSVSGKDIGGAVSAGARSTVAAAYLLGLAASVAWGLSTSVLYCIGRDCLLWPFLLSAVCASLIGTIVIRPLLSAILRVARIEQRRSLLRVFALIWFFLGLLVCWWVHDLYSTFVAFLGICALLVSGCVSCVLTVRYYSTTSSATPEHIRRVRKRKAMVLGVTSLIPCVVLYFVLTPMDDGIRRKAAARRSAVAQNRAAQERRAASANSLSRLKADSNRGVAAASYQLFKKYDRGEGVTRDVNRGARYLRLAADQGHAQAQCVVGVMLVESPHTDSRGKEEGHDFIRRSARQGYDLAQQYLNARER